MRAKPRDITGLRSGKLVAVEPAGVTSFGKSRWLTVCDCGKTRICRKSDITAGTVTSCGCALGAHHGGTGGRLGKKTPEYHSWCAMIQRCTNPNNVGYKFYGGRGIKIAQRWRESFAAFLEDMGPRPSRWHSLDRYPNVNGDYEKGNCRWATSAEQQHNKRNSTATEAQYRAAADLIVSGWSNAEIVAEIGVSNSTVTSVARRLMRERDRALAEIEAAMEAA